MIRSSDPSAPERRDTGYTLLEIVIASGLFAVFLAGVMLLLRSGQQAGNQSVWLQQNAMEIRNAFSHIGTAIGRSSYPSAIIFPGQITENSRDEFKVHLTPRATLCATEAVAFTAGGGPATQFLRFTESSPERINFEQSTPASLTYHIYSLTNTGKILYHRYSESVVSGETTHIKHLTRTRIPPEEASQTSFSELVSDVESVRIEPADSAFSVSSFQLVVTCANPRGKTRRSERLTCVPNVGIVVHPQDPDW